MNHVLRLLLLRLILLHIVRLLLMRLQVRCHVLLLLLKLRRWRHAVLHRSASVHLIGQRLSLQWLLLLLQWVSGRRSADGRVVRGSALLIMHELRLHRLLNNRLRAHAHLLGWLLLLLLRCSLLLLLPVSQILLLLMRRQAEKSRIVEQRSGWRRSGHIRLGCIRGVSGRGGRLLRHRHWLWLHHV